MTPIRSEDRRNGRGRLRQYVHFLGVLPDKVVAARFDASVEAVMTARRSRGIPAVPPPRVPRVPPLAQSKARFWGKVNKLPGDGCWEWTGSTSRGGYGAFLFNQVRWPAHRLAMTWEAGPIDPALFVCHRCDNRLCVRPDHLFLGTQQDNIDDMMRKGRNKIGRRWCGADNHNAKLDDETVLAIRAEHAAGGKYRPMGRKYGVNRTTIKAIVERRSWGHLP